MLAMGPGRVYETRISSRTLIERRAPMDSCWVAGLVPIKTISVNAGNRIESASKQFSHRKAIFPSVIPAINFLKDPAVGGNAQRTVSEVDIL